MKRLRPTVGSILFLSLALPVLAQAAEWAYLPVQPLFQPLVADPRESRGAILCSAKGNRLDAVIGKTLPLLRRQGDEGAVEWGIHAAAFPYLKQKDLKFPMQENDWWFGTYLSGGRQVRWRLDYTHVSSHLGDALFQEVQPIVYSREFVRFLASLRGPFTRLYVGPGWLVHTLPQVKTFFLQAGAEWTSRPLTGAGRLYAAWDVKVKREAGGVTNHTLQGGWQFGDAERGRTMRLGLQYFKGHSENGQFYLAKEDRLSFGVFFDP